MLCCEGGSCFVGTSAIDHNFCVAIMMFERGVHVLRMGRDGTRNYARRTRLARANIEENGLFLIIQ